MRSALHEEYFLKSERLGFRCRSQEEDWRERIVRGTPSAEFGFQEED